MADIFQEIDEDLRRDRASALWARYQNWVYTAVAVVILGTAGVTAWRIYHGHAREQAGAAYLEALQMTAQDPKGAVEVFAKLAETAPPVAPLARFDMARAALLAGDKVPARDMLTTMAGDARLDPPMRGAAALMGAYLSLDLGESAQAVTLVEPLLAPDHPYRLAALEVTGLAAFADGDTARAREIFTELEPLAAAPDAPSQLRERVAILLDRLNQ